MKMMYLILLLFLRGSSLFAVVLTSCLSVEKKKERKTIE